MAWSSQQEGGALMIMQRQLHGNHHSNEGSVATDIAAWQLEEDGPMSPSARSSYMLWCLSGGASLDALLHAQALARQRSMTAALLSSNSNNTNDEVHIPVLEDDFDGLIANSSPHAHINISQSSSPERETEVAEPLLNRPRLTEVFLVIAAQVAVTLSTAGSKPNNSGSSSLSPNAKILLEFAMACNVIGFLFCLYGILLSGRKPGIGARILTGIGYAATVFGVLAVMCMQLQEHTMMWVTPVTYIASFPALAAAFMKRNRFSPPFLCQKWRWGF